MSLEELIERQRRALNRALRSRRGPAGRGKSSRPPLQGRGGTGVRRPATSPRTLTSEFGPISPLEEACAGDELRPRSCSASRRISKSAIPLRASRPERIDQGPPEPAQAALSNDSSSSSQCRKIDRVAATEDPQAARRATSQKRPNVGQTRTRHPEARREPESLRRGNRTQEQRRGAAPQESLVEIRLRSLRPLPTARSREQGGRATGKPWLKNDPALTDLARSRMDVRPARTSRQAEKSRSRPTEPKDAAAAGPIGGRGTGTPRRASRRAQGQGIAD